MKKFFVIIILLINVSPVTWCQTVAAKTNLLYDLTTTINLGMEIAVAPKWTIELPVNYNPWDFSQNRLVLATSDLKDGYKKIGGGTTQNVEEAETSPVARKFKHWLIEPEARYWFCEKFNGHFFGIHLLAAGYNIVGINTFGLGGLYGMGDVKDQKYIYPSNSDPSLLDYRYEGLAYGGGVSYGYHWILGTHWSLEATLGVGYIYQNYKKYDCPVCGKHIGAETKGRVAPTKAGVSLIYIIK